MMAKILAAICGDAKRALHWKINLWVTKDHAFDPEQKYGVITYPK